MTDRVFMWIDPRLTGSLEVDSEATAKAKNEAAKKHLNNLFVIQQVIFAPAGVEIE